MKYILLLYSAEQAPPENATEEERMAALQPWFDYTKAMQDAGVYLGGDALQPTASATSLRVREGDVTTTNGPFAETTEVLGGYYLVQVENEAQALEWAQRCPLAHYGTVEVRPLMEFDTP